MKALGEFIRRHEPRWAHIIFFTIWHVVGIYGYLTFPYLQNKMTFLWFILTCIFYGMGTTMGVNRLWTHRSYKATAPLRLILAFSFYGTGMYTIFEWVRLHRVHHKYSETDADPHNSKRGFFFAHIGWIISKKSDECVKRLREVDMSDIKADPIAQLGDKFFPLMVLLNSFIIPTIIPVYFWNENWYWAIISQVFMRFILLLNAACSVNSIAHMWGSKPYDREIHPVENNISNLLTFGEGYHNYHHTFPWDYKGAELGNRRFNFSTFAINQFAKIGWAYDLKEPSEDLIKMTYQSRGDGSHPKLKD